MQTSAIGVNINIKKGSLVGGSSLIISSTVHNPDIYIEWDFSVLTRSSKLYSYICDVKRWDIDKSEHKKRAKEYVFGCIYGSFRPTTNVGKERRTFMKNHFPDTLDTIDKLKKSFVNHFKKMKENDRKRYNSIAIKNGEPRSVSKMASNSLSILLQRLEAYLFIDQILKECVRCNIFCAPKHDSILYPKSCKARVERITAIQSLYISH